jgi:hypothetical protein
MNHHDPQRLANLSPPLRIALGAACAERVLPVFETDYAPGDLRPRAAVDLAWNVAIGVSVQSATLSEARAAASDAMPSINESTAARDSCLTAICLIDVISESNLSALRELMGTATSVAELLEDDDEEFRWQASAIEIAERHVGPITRKLFASIESTPKWFVGFDEVG